MNKIYLVLIHHEIPNFKKNRLREFRRAIVAIGKFEIETNQAIQSIMSEIVSFADWKLAGKKSSWKSSLQPESLSVSREAEGAQETLSQQELFQKQDIILSLSTALSEYKSILLQVQNTLKSGK